MAGLRLIAVIAGFPQSMATRFCEPGELEGRLVADTAYQKTGVAENRSIGVMEYSRFTCQGDEQEFGFSPQLCELCVLCGESGFLSLVAVLRRWACLW
jgi:hypothetical protein